MTTRRTRAAGLAGRAMLEGMELHLFEEVAVAVRGMVPPELGELHARAHRQGVKLWFGAGKPDREHYEAQIITTDGTLALEVGFHAEHSDLAENEKVIERLLGHEDRWRSVLGEDAVAGPFLGRPNVWRRVSETWANPDLSDGDLAIEVALRLAEYVTVLERVRREP